MTIIVSVFLRGYRGKTIDFAQVSQHHRTATAYFLSHGKWNGLALEDALKSSAVQIIYPCEIRQKSSEFALHLKKTDSDVCLVTVGGREFYVY